MTTSVDFSFALQCTNKIKAPRMEIDLKIPFIISFRLESEDMHLVEDFIRMGGIALLYTKPI